MDKFLGKQDCWASSLKIRPAHVVLSQPGIWTLYLLVGELQEYLKNFAQSASLTLVHVSSCLNNWYCTSMKQDHSIQESFHMNDISIINLLLSDLHNLFFILRFFLYKFCMNFFSFSQVY